MTAQIAYARHLIDTGWKVRGGDIAANIPKEIHDEFSHYLRTASGILEQVASRAGDDPYLEASALQTAPAFQLTSDSVSNVILKGLKKNPRCTAALDGGAMFLMDRWTGNPAAASQLAERIRSEIPGESGSALVAALAILMYRAEPDRWDNDHGFEYTQFEKDYSSLKKLCPDGNVWKVTACRMAILNSKTADARTLWRSLGTRVDLGRLSGFASFAEWNDRIEGTPRDSLVWSVLGDVPGKLAMSPEGDHLLAISPAGRMRFLETEDGKVVGLDRGEFLRPLAVAVPKVDHVIIAAETGILHYRNDGRIQRLRYPRAIPISSARFSQDGTRLVAISTTGSVMFFDTTSGKLLSEATRTIEGADQIEIAVAVSRDGSRAAVATAVGVVQVFDVDKGIAVAKLSTTDGRVSGLCFHSGTSKLAAVGNKTVWEWDLDQQTQSWSVKSPTISPVSLEVTQDGMHWALHCGYSGATADAEVRILHRKTDPEKWLSLPEIRCFSNIAWHPRKPLLAVYSSSGIISMWNAENIP